MSKLAHRALSEFLAKRIIGTELQKLSQDIWDFTKCVIINQDTQMDELLASNQWLDSSRVVIKPDVLIGKRGKYGLVSVDLDWINLRKYVEENLGKSIRIGGTEVILKRFIIEPYVNHDSEYYVSIFSERTRDKILFSPNGGTEIEEIWDTMQEFELGIGEPIEECIFSDLYVEENRHFNQIKQFIMNLMKIYIGLDLSSLEINPFTIVDGVIYPLDMKVEVDGTAAYIHKDSWGTKLETETISFNRVLSKEEEFIRKLDSSTGASLKFVLLNPKGRIWTLIAGGGASVIYTDAILEAGYSNELANYGEYSGNPNKEHVKLYSQTIIDLMCEDQSNLPKVLLIGGGIANFTDVKSTFLGIANAIQENASKIRNNEVKIFVRRGGPNEKEGLMMLKELGENLDIPIEVYDRFTPMTHIVSKALEEIK